MPPTVRTAARPLAALVLALALVSGSAAAQVAGDEAAVDAVLTSFHEAASRADAEAYFGCFAPDAVFIGTDASERWTVEAFRAYAMPYFDRGQGWTYVATERHVTIGPDGRTAWFDEMLDNASYGVTRGTGVLVRDARGDWKVAQYHLTIPVPNELARDVVEMIRALRGGGEGSGG